MCDVGRPQPEVGPKPRLSLSQVDELLEAVNETEQVDRNSAIVLLMVDSGLRIGEVVNLRLIDINFDDNTAFVRGTKVRKTRYVPLSAKTVVALEAYLLKRRSLAFVCSFIETYLC
jgi:integrase/recombinase XerD